MRCCPTEMFSRNSGDALSIGTFIDSLTCSRSRWRPRRLRQDHHVHPQGHHCRCRGAFVLPQVHVSTFDCLNRGQYFATAGISDPLYTFDADVDTTTDSLKTTAVQAKAIVLLSKKWR